jgi:hypothetical protein
MTAPLTFHQPYPGGRMVLRLGKHDVGAVFPPAGSPPDRLPWVWRFWLGGHVTPGSLSVAFSTEHGRAKSELAAKNALLAKAEEWIRDAGLTG